jgi:hypothetical protein
MLALSDLTTNNVALAVIAVATVVGPIATAILNHIQAKQAVAKVEAARATLEANTKASVAKLNEMAKVGVATHVLVNSNFATQLQLNAAVTRRLADLTGDPKDEEAARLAQSLYDQHAQKQGMVDREQDKQDKQDKQGRS